MRLLLTQVLLILTLSGCATDVITRPGEVEPFRPWDSGVQITVVPTQPRAAKLPGAYSGGDGYERNVIVILKPSGMYRSVWEGCMGISGRAAGTWQLQGDQILFTPTMEEEKLKGYLRQVTMVRHGGRLGFVRSQDIRQDQTDESFLFSKVSRKTEF